MANAVIWFYPSSTTGLVEIDLGEGLSDLQVDPIREVEDARAYDGTLYRSVLSGRERVRIVLDRFTDAALAAKLETLQSHLDRGGSISFCSDKDKAWAGFSNTSLATETVIPTEGNAFTAYNEYANLAAGDVMCVESVNPEAIREFVSVDAVAAADLAVTAQTAILYEFTILPVLVRFRDFWPVLQLPAGQMGRSIVTHDHRISYTLDMALETNPATIAALASGGADSLGSAGEDTGQGGSDSLDDQDSGSSGVGGGALFGSDKFTDHLPKGG